MTVAVTGASGHVGACLSRRLLEEGLRVRLLVHRDNRALEGLPAERAFADLSDPPSLNRALRGVHTVYHLAASISLDRRHRESLKRINIDGTGHLIRACLDCSVKRLIHFSSIEALADLNPGKATDETNPLADSRGTTYYGWTKAQAERLVLKAAGELSAVVLAPTAMLGPYDFKPSHLGRALLDLYHGRLPALIEGGFSWVDVRDVAEAAVAARERGRAGQRYILGGSWRTLVQMAELVGSIRGRLFRRPILPIPLARTAAALAGFLPGLFTRYPAFAPDALLAIGKHREISSQKAGRELGFRSRPLEQSLRDTFRWFEQQGMLDP